MFIPGTSLERWRSLLVFFVTVSNHAPVPERLPISDSRFCARVSVCYFFVVIFIAYEFFCVCVREGSQSVTSAARLQKIYGVMEILQMRSCRTASRLHWLWYDLARQEQWSFIGKLAWQWATTKKEEFRRSLVSVVFLVVPLPSCISNLF